MLEELEVVELTHDIRKHKLKKGDKGTVVFVYESASGRSRAYEVEFVAPNGRTIAVLTLMSDDIRAYINKDEYVDGLFNAPVSLGTVSGMTLDTIVNNDELRITTETFKSKADKNEYQQIAAL